MVVEVRHVVEVDVDSAVEGVREASAADQEDRVVSVVEDEEPRGAEAEGTRSTHRRC